MPISFNISINAGLLFKVFFISFKLFLEFFLNNGGDFGRKKSNEGKGGGGGGAKLLSLQFEVQLA